MENLPFWLLTVAYSAHILEEYMLDWRGWAQQISKMSLSWTDFFLPILRSSSWVFPVP
jgi:hypothetical protein